MERRVVGALVSALLMAAALVAVGSGTASAACPVTGCPGGGTSGYGYVHVTKVAGGTGNTAPLPAITDDQGEISCGADCTGRYAWSCDEYGDCTYTPVTLSAPATTGWQVSFSGCDTNGTTCGIAEPSSSSLNPQEVTASFYDVQPPSAGLASPPAAGTSVNRVQLAVDVADNDMVKQVQWSYSQGGGVFVNDGAAISNPGSRVTHTFSDNIADGTYTFRAEARDYSGNLSFATIRLVLDRTPPSLAVTSGPGDGASVAASPTFGFTAEPGSAVRCSLDGGAQRACSGDADDALPALAEGSHTWAVEAQDAAENTATVTRHFTLDTTPPGRVIDRGPADGATVTGSSVSFGFTTEPGASVACSLDGETYRTCSGAGNDDLTHLSDGQHVWQARAADAAGNSTVVTRVFKVALAVPHITTAVQHRWSVKHGRTSVVVLRTGRLPAGARVVVTCKGPHRPFVRRTFQPSAQHVVDLRSSFRKPLAAGVTVTVAMIDHGYVGRAFRFTTRRHGQPSYTTVTLPKS